MTIWKCGACGEPMQELPWVACDADGEVIEGDAVRLEMCAAPVGTSKCPKCGADRMCCEFEYNETDRPPEKKQRKPRKKKIDTQPTEV